MSIFYALDVFVPQRTKLIVLSWFLQGMQGLRGRPGSRGDMGPIVSVYGVGLLWISCERGKYKACLTIPY